MPIPPICEVSHPEATALGIALVQGDAVDDGGRAVGVIAAVWAAVCQTPRIGLGHGDDASQTGSAVLAPSGIALSVSGGGDHANRQITHRASKAHAVAAQVSGVDDVGGSIIDGLNVAAVVHAAQPRAREFTSIADGQIVPC